MSNKMGNVLIVDDTPANLRLLSQMLRERGYHPRPVMSGMQALKAVQAELPDLILLDIRMPEMNGYEVCKLLKTNTRTQDIPVIFISAMDATQDKVRAFSVGGVDYITKPFQVEEVIARVKTHITLQQLQTQLQETNRKMRQELALAGDVQTSFLPKEMPQIKGWQFSATLLSARETSGDFYDVIHLPDGKLVLLIADVVDKGVGAALFMSLSWILLRNYAVEFPDNPEEVFREVNKRILLDTRGGQFLTVFYAILDPQSGEIKYSNAGHPPAYVINTQELKLPSELKGTGPPIGVFEDATWEMKTVTIAEEDVLLLYTDGVPDARNREGEYFREEKMLNSVSNLHSESVFMIQDGLLTDVMAFQGEEPQHDDITLMLIKRES